MTEQQNTSHKYIAFLNGQRLMSFRAGSREEAVGELIDQLDRPGRREILRDWKASGAVLVEEIPITGLNKAVFGTESPCYSPDNMDEMIEKFAAYIKANGIYYYAQPRESFFEYEAYRECLAAGLRRICMEDLS